MKKTSKLKKLLKHGTVIAPGVSDGLGARLVERAGFEAVYASGGAIARSMATPDIGLLSFGEILNRLKEIVQATTLPVIADADTGYGNVVNVERTVREFEMIGLAGLHLEDQQLPKRCGHLDGKSLVSMDEMAQKIRVAKQTRIDPDFLLIARTDAIAVEGLDKAIERAKYYLQHGADMIFVEAPQSVSQIEQIADALPQPKLINMFYGGKTPLVPMDKLKSMGYELVIIPSDLQRAAIYGMQEVLKIIKQNGDSEAISDKLITFKQREDIVETKRYLDLDKS